MAEAKNNDIQDIDKLEAEFKADPSKFVPLAKAYMERALPVQAIQVCKDGLKRSPQIPDGQLALAMAYYHNYDDGHAEVELKKFLKSSSDNAVAHRTLGEIFLERKQEQKAIGELMRALELDPSDTHTRSLLQSLGEKLPPLKTDNGHGKITWLPRQIHDTRVPPRPLWRAVAQVVVVGIIMALFIVWYYHHVEIITTIRKDIKEASKLIPRDNFDDLNGAEAWLDKVLALDDDNPGAIIRLSQIDFRLMSQHDQSDKKALLQQHLKFFEDEELQVSERYATKGYLMLIDGKAEQAVKMLSDVVKRAIEKKDIFLNAEVFGARGLAHLALGNMKEAREDFSRAAKFSPMSPHYQALFANVYLREGNLGRALRYFRDALKKNPDHIFSNIRYAHTRIQTGKNLEKAKKILDNLMDKDKHQEKEFSPPMLSMLYQVRGEYDLLFPTYPELFPAARAQDANQMSKAQSIGSAKQWADKAIATWGSNAEAWDLKGRIAAIQKDATAAANAFAKALQLDPRLPKIYFDRAESTFAMGQKQEAVDKLKEFERSLKPTVAYHVKRGDLLMRMDKLDEAQKEFQAAITVDELDPKGRFWLAKAYQAMGDKISLDDKEHKADKLEFYNKAREEYENAIMLPGGETPEVYRQMGLIYLASEDFENALDKLAKAVMMMTKAGDPPGKIADVYTDISKIFKEMGGEEGQKQEQEYLMKAAGLRQGKTVDEVEKEWQAKQKAEQKKKKKRRRRRRRRRHR